MRIAVLLKKSETRPAAGWDCTRITNQPPLPLSNILRKKGFEDSPFNRIAKPTVFPQASLKTSSSPTQETGLMQKSQLDAFKISKSSGLLQGPGFQRRARVFPE
jgi:hypothetical protein